MSELIRTVEILLIQQMLVQVQEIRSAVFCSNKFTWITLQYTKKLSMEILLILIVTF